MLVLFSGEYEPGPRYWEVCEQVWTKQLSFRMPLLLNLSSSLKNMSINPCKNRVNHSWTKKYFDRTQAMPLKTRKKAETGGKDGTHFAQTPSFEANLAGIPCRYCLFECSVCCNSILSITLKPFDACISLVSMHAKLISNLSPLFLPFSLLPSFTLVFTHHPFLFKVI